MKKYNLQTGKLGEEVAKNYLEKRGYKILEQNYKTKYAEIDLVCRQGNELVVVEVRTKKGEDFGSPEESLNRSKMQKLRLNTESYVFRKKWQGPYRVDAICIVLKQDNVVERLNYYQNIV